MQQRGGDSLPVRFSREIGQTAGGSRGFVRDVAMRIPIPSRTTTPTRIQVGGTFNRYAAIPNPMMRIMKPTRYVPKDDIAVSGRVIVMHEQATYRTGKRETATQNREP